ncbi:hypothetical protein HDR65_03575 [bacterium]|nr:hypothetical protein [bacterium]
MQHILCHKDTIFSAKKELEKNKKSPVKGRGINLMFSQRNNPYCDSLHFSVAKIGRFSQMAKSIRVCFRVVIFCIFTPLYALAVAVERKMACVARLGRVQRVEK